MSLLLEARLWWGKKRFGSLGPSVVRVSKDRVIKGPCESAELEALKYVAQYTSIPVPKVHRTYHVDGRLYIEMEYLEGETLQDAWLGHLSSAEKKAVVGELAGYIRQLRLLEPPQRGVVASAEFKQCLDYRVGYAPVGPFLNHEEFHSFLRGSIPLENCTQVYGESVTIGHTRQYRTTFCHADLCARNLIVRDGKTVAIVDWQFAGWYPEYWEYTKAHFGLLNMPDWYAEFQRAVTRYDEPLAAERALWQQFDQPGMAHQWVRRSPGSVKE
jgi:tRNA A-37 threonylcarbamoyl transferase component Bud32